MQTIFYLFRKVVKRSSGDLMLSFLSLLVGVFLFASIFVVTRSVSDYFYSQSVTLLGGDVVLNSSAPIDLDPNIKNKIKDNRGIISKELTAQILIKNESGSSSAAVSVRAVDSYFPLRGILKIKDSTYEQTVGSVYVEEKVLTDLKLQVGEYIYVSEKKFIVAGIIEKEPDGVSIGISFVPRVIMSLVDFDSLGVASDNARISYKSKVLLGDGPDKGLNSEIVSYAKSIKVRVDDASDGPNTFLRSLSSVNTFIGIAVSISIFLVYVNIASNLALLLFKFRKNIALFKVLGLPSRSISLVYTFIFSFVGLASGLLGGALSTLIMSPLLKYISQRFEVQLVFSDTYFVIIFATLFSVLLINLSALPFLNDLKNINAKILLSSNYENLKKTSRVLYYLPIPILLFLAMYILSKNILLSIYGIGGLVIVFLFYFLMSRFIISILYKYRNNFSFNIKSIASFLKWRGFETYVISAAIMTALSGVFIISTIEENILLNLRREVSINTPALYMINITNSQIEAVRSLSGSSFEEFPIIRARLLSVGGRDITAVDNPELTREFNITYRNNLIRGEKIVSGKWHGDTGGIGEVSIDKEFLDSVGGKMGDEAVIFVQGLNVKGIITSVRDTDRSSGLPFFYLVFSPEVLKDFPKSYFATANLNETQIQTLQNQLADKYPNIIPINTKNIVNTVNDIVINIVKLVNIIGIPSIVLGIILTLTMSAQSIRSRVKDLLTMSAFGMARLRLVYIIVLEMLVLLTIAGFMAYVVAHIIAFALNRFLFEFDSFTLATTPIFIFLIMIFVVTIFIYFFVKKVLSVPLRSVLLE